MRAARERAGDGDEAGDTDLRVIDEHHVDMEVGLSPEVRLRLRDEDDLFAVLMTDAGERRRRWSWWDASSDQRQGERDQAKPSHDGSPSVGVSPGSASRDPRNV
jgi:hypothetical protein